MQDPLGLLTTNNAPTDDPLGLMVSEEPRISQAPEPTFWEKAGDKIKDFLNPHAPGQMAPADIADAQIRLEARKKGLTKEAYTRQVNPDGEFNRRVTRTGKNIVAGAVSTAEGMAGGFEWLTNGAMGQDLANQAKLWAQDLSPEEHDFSDAVASGMGSTATFFIPGMGIAKGAGAIAKVTPRLASWLGVSAATSMEAMTEAGQVYRDVLNKTKDESKAGSAATKTFWGNIPLLAITNKLGIYGEKGTQAKRTLTSMAMEGAQEGGQEAISEKASGDPLNLLNIAESAGVGAVTGGLFSLRGGHDVANAPSETTPGTGTTPGGGKEAPATPPLSGNKHENMIQKIKDILAEGDENKQAYIEQQKAKPETPAPEQAPAPVKEVTPETVPTPEEQATRNIVLPLPEYSTTNGWKRETIQALNDGRDPINAAANWYRDEGKMYGGEKRLTQRVNSFIGEWKKQNQTPTPTPEAAEITAAANEAATSPQNDTPEPTPAQIEAGNYKKGHVNFNGLDITIENPAGSTRKGVDEHGNEWETELVHHYGYIKGTTGKDGDHVDIFMPEDIGPNNNKVFVVDQKDNVTGNFDEHKVMLGFDSLKNAREGYLDNYDESGPDRIMNITEMSVDDFKDWLKNGSQNKPAVSYFKAPAKRTADDTNPGTSEAENFGLDNPETDMSKHKPLPEQVTPKNADLFENERGAIDLHILGVPQIVNATRKLIQKIDPKAARNIAVQTNKEDKLGFVKGVIGSPSAIIGKAQYYVIHAKNAMLKQERLRGIVKDKTGKIFNSLSKEQAKEFENLLWLGDADGKNYTEADLDEMDVSSEVKAAYLAQRKFHDQVWRMMKVHRKAYGMDVSGMEGVKGHIPHLFENWNVYEMVEEEVEGKDGETEIVTVPGPIAGTFRSLKEATEFANTLNPNIEYLIKPKTFRMPDDVIAKTVLKDSSYFKMVEKVEKEFQLTKDEAHEIVGNVARLKGRHRILGNLMKREGQTGFRKDNIRDILTEYYNSAARYIAMDDFKARVVPKFEKDFGIELGRADQAIRDKNTARYVQEYINDINGVPGMIEDMMNAAIMKHPFFAKRVSSQRPAVWAINKAMHVTAVCKLGLLNLSSGIVNLAQLTNTFAILPTKEFSYAFGKVLSGRLSGSERRLLKRLGIEYDLGLSDTGGYSAIHKGGKIVDASLFFFRKAEYLNRAISGLAAYRTAQNQGMNNDAARIYARQIIDRTQFDYSVADTARIFRNPIGRFAGQFKPYAIKQIEFIVGLKGAENIKFWVPMLLMAGGAGIPMIEGLSELIEWLTGTNPLTEVKEFLMKWAGDDQEKKAVARVAMYGVASVLNVDISRRVGTGDIIPKRPSDLLGPTIGSVMQFIESKDATTAVKALAPSIGNLLTAIETARNDMTVTDPYHRDRGKFKASKMDVAAKAAGFRTVKESEYSDAQNIANYERQKYTKIQQKYIDKAIEALQNKDTEGFTDAITKAAEKGVVIDSQDIKREFINKLLPQNIRMIRNTRKAQRADVAELNDYLDEEEYEDEE